MLSITYLVGVGDLEKSQTFHSIDEFVTLQQREVPTIQDFLVAKEVLLDGQAVNDLARKRLEDVYKYFAE